MPKTIPKLNPKWILETRKHFLEFLQATKFPHPDRNGNRGSKFDYPEWLIMFIAVLTVKYKLKTYLAIHRFVKDNWKPITKGCEFKKIICESNLRDRLKKICHFPRKPATFIFQIFSKDYLGYNSQR